MGFLSAETAKHLIAAAFDAATTGDEIIFSFQGGEPTLAGLDFFKEFIKTEKLYIKPGVSVAHSIQTNGLCINEEWAEFLRENDFLVGLSVDGSKKLHDLYRKDATGSGTWNRIVRSLAILCKHKVEVNLLCVVTGQCARSPQMVYNSLKKLGVRYLQFIPCLDPLEGAGGDTFFSLSASSYGKFLCGLFDVWYLDWKRGEYISVRLFDDYVHLLLGQACGTCATSGSCGRYYVVEGDGGVYPCDFFVLDKWKLGNINETPFAQIIHSDKAREFTAEGDIHPDECDSCCWLKMCNGGCKRDWHMEEGVLKNRYCAAFKQLFDYAEDRLKEIARFEREAVDAYEKL